MRRVQSPEEISEVYADVMRYARTADIVAELIGPAIRFHHGKVNSKLPGAATKVKFHQDFTFQPMTNDDLITALLFVDEVTLENGPLEVVPGSHKGPLYTFWHDGVLGGIHRPSDGSANSVDLSEMNPSRCEKFQARDIYLREWASETLALTYGMHWPNRRRETARSLRRTRFHHAQKTHDACFTEMQGCRARWRDTGIPAQLRAPMLRASCSAYLTHASWAGKSSSHPTLPSMCSTC